MAIAKDNLRAAVHDTRLEAELAQATLVCALAVLVGSAALAGLIPATHAASIKPIEALRTE